MQADATVLKLAKSLFYLMQPTFSSRPRCRQHRFQTIPDAEKTAEPQGDERPLLPPTGPVASYRVHPDPYRCGSLRPASSCQPRSVGDQCDCRELLSGNR